MEVPEPLSLFCSQLDVICWFPLICPLEIRMYCTDVIDLKIMQSVTYSPLLRQQ
jgi:hypothetical protein